MLLMVTIFVINYTHIYHYLLIFFTLLSFSLISWLIYLCIFFFFYKQKTAYEILALTGVQTCALPIYAVPVHGGPLLRVEVGQLDAQPAPGALAGQGAGEGRFPHPALLAHESDHRGHALLPAD